MNTVSFWPILVSSIVAFGIGALWYSPILFGKELMEFNTATGRTFEKDTRMWKRYITQFVMTIIMFMVIAFAVVSSGSIGSTNGAFVGFLAWLGLILPIAVSNMLWKNEPSKMTLIDSVNSLVVLVIGGAIIGAWQ